MFVAVRLALLYAREPFFDELFTVWMARQPFGKIAQNLLYDSGPPLYYFLARFDSVIALRWLSLIFAAMQFGLVVRRSVLAAVLLALYPPAALFAVDARAYALCALFVTAGVIALESEKPLLAALALALAAHTHYYGVLFFPLLLLRRQFRAFTLAIVLFLPGFLLAFHQPVEAMKWNRESLFAPLANLSFAGLYPPALFVAAPLILVLIATVLLVLCGAGNLAVCGAGNLAGDRRRDRRRLTYALAVAVPFVLVFVFHLAGRPVYFPMRFEAVIAGPLVLWIACSLERYPARWRQALAGALLIIGAYSIYTAVLDHLRRPLDDYRQAALVLRQIAPKNQVTVATGYCYLETVVALKRDVVAWPADQARHPGWRSTAQPDPFALPRGSFLWIGERLAPEVRVLPGVKKVRPVFWNGRALIARADDLTPPVH